MASSLAQQLQQLQQQQGPSKKVRGKVSLLFDYQKAADVDLQTIYDIGCQGFDELVRLEPRFLAYREQLFSRAAAALDREQQAPDVVAALDASLNAFLRMLTNHILVPGAFKVLEYLLRRFRVNEKNGDALLAAVLPYHATNEFVRVIQTLPLAEGKGTWGWLARAQSSGASLPREVLVKRCINDGAVLRFVCESAKLAGARKGPGSSRTFLSFYAVLLCEVAAEANVDESLLSVLLPYISAGLDGDASSDYRAATLMVVAELCSKAQLGKTFLKAVVNSTVRNIEPTHDHIRTVLLVLAHMAATQPQLQALPEKALKALVALPSLQDELSSLADASVRLAPLLRLLALSLVHRMAASSSPEKYEAHVVNLVKAGVLEAVAQELSRAVLDAAAAPSLQHEGQAAAGLLPALQRVLRSLDVHHPEQLDAAVNAALAPLRAVKPKADGEGSDDEDDEGEAPAKEDPKAAAVFKVVKEALGASARAPCGDAALTLAAAAIAPAEHVRRMAILQMDTVLQDSTVTAEARAQMHSCVLTALQDSSFEVVNAALGAACLQQMEPAALLPVLQALLRRLAAPLFGSGKVPELKAVRAAAKSVLDLLVQLLTVSSQAELRDTTVLVLLEYALPTKNAYRLCKLAVAAAQKLDHPLAKALASLQELSAAVGDAAAAAEAGQEEAAADAKKGGKKGSKSKAAEGGQNGQKRASKEQQTEAVTALSRGIVEAVAKAIGSNPQQVVPEVLKLATLARDDATAAGAAEDAYTPSLRARHVLTMALHAVLARAAPRASARGGAAAAATAAARALVQLSLQELASVTAAAGGKSQQLLQGWEAAAGEALDAAGLPMEPHAGALLQSPAATHAALLCRALQAALTAVPEFEAPEGDAATEPAAAAAAAGLAAAAVYETFASLAALHPAGSFDAHMRLLVSKALPGLQQQLLFLASVYAAPEEAAAAAGATPLQQLYSAQGRAAALRLHASLVQQAGSSGAAALLEVLPHVLAAASSSHAEVRRAAVPALTATAAGLAAARGAGAAGCAAVAAMVSALTQPQQSALIEADASAACLLLRNTFAVAAAGGAAGVPPPSPMPATPATTKKRGKAAAAQSAAGAQEGANGRVAPGARLEVESASATASYSALASQLGSLPLQQGLFHACAARSLLAALLTGEDALPGSSGQEQAAAAPAAAASAAQRGQLVPAACSLLQLLLDQPHALSTVESEVGALLAGVLFTTEGLQAASSAQQLLVSVLSTTSADAALLRLAALTSLRRGPVAALQQLLPLELQVKLFGRLLSCAAGDVDAGCRTTARAVLEEARVSAAVLVPVLQAAAAAGSSGAQQQAEAAAAAAQKKKKARKGVASTPEPQAPAAAAAAAAPVDPAAAAAALQLAVLALELLQWKEQVQGLPQVVEAVQQLLESLRPTLAPIAVAHGSDEAADEAEDVKAEAAGAGAEDVLPPPSLSGYAAQLALSALEAIARRCQPASPGASMQVDGDADAAAGAAAALPAFRLELVVGVAQQAPDSGVRNGALALLGVLASAAPEAALDHVLQVLALVNQSTAMQEDAHSQKVAATALAGVVPAWLAAGKELSAIWSVVVGALPGLPAHRRLALLSTLLAATPQAESLPTALLLLIESAAEAQQQPAAAGAAAQAQQQELSQHDWLLELAAQLSQQVALALRLRCFARLLELCVQKAGGKAHRQLPRTAVVFVATQLQLKGRSRSSPSAAAAEEEPELQAACEALMQQALAQVLSLTALLGSDMDGEQAPAAAPTPAPKGKKLQAAAAPATPLNPKLMRSVRASVEGLYELCGALQGVMASHAYLQALLRLASQPSDKVRRRALKLFADKARATKLELEEIELELPPKARGPAQQRITAAAMAVCGLLTTGGAAASMADASPLTRQALLVALSSVALVHGGRAPEQLMSALPAVLAAVKDAHVAVRGSALAAVAAVVRAVGARLVPLLPATASAVLEAATAAAGQLPAPGADADGESAVELAAAVAALEALVDSVGAFLSPQLPKMFALLLDPRILSCTAAGVSRTAASVRERLPQALPPRLLLEPMFGSLQGAVAAGAASCCCLLDTVAAVAGGMDAKTAAAHHEALFGFLLKALDLRQQRPASLAGRTHEVESAAIRALVALVLKLSEVRFKPMFLRLMEWTTASSTSTDGGAAWTGASGGAPLGRAVALFGAVCALSQHLRSVFVPYYRYLLDLAVKTLAAPGASGATPRPKKKSKKAAVEAQEGDGEEAAFVVEARWVLRLRAVRALHRCFLYDTVSFVDQDKVDRLLPPLVAQLEAEPPADVLPVLTAQGADAELDATVRFAPRSPANDLYGTAAVAVLVQLAVAVNSDVHWKPLNRQVLMVTRSPSARSRVLALEVVAHLVERLREEYLVLLPETIPFLSELLEDSDAAVESRAQDIVRSLEEISGEKLDAYLKA